MRNTTNTLPSKSSSLEVGAGVFRVSFRQRERERERVRESVCVILIKISRGVIFWRVRFLFPFLVTRAPNSEKNCVSEERPKKCASRERLELQTTT